MSETAAPEPGTPVDYHGSLADYHGPATVQGLCICPQRCPGAGTRFHLISDESGERLGCARRASFTVTEQEGPAQP
jgi:hypothetical protein